jgi:tryptophan-rich sensory protein
MAEDGVGRDGGAWPRWAAAGLAAGVLGVSAIIGRRNAPDPAHPGIRHWYRHLDKPDFTPPDRVFGAVWPVLETLAAVGGYRLLRRPASPQRNAAVALWLADSAMIGGWTELFFRRKSTGASAVAAGAMAGGRMALAATAWRVDRPAAISVIPLASWLGFATVLATSVWRRNPTRASET